jgi:hypothetical protein
VNLSVPTTDRITLRQRQRMVAFFLQLLLNTQLPPIIFHFCVFILFPRRLASGMISCEWASRLSFWL